MQRLKVNNEWVAAAADRLIPRHKIGERTVIKTEANTLDILREVVTTCHYSNWQVKEFARYLRNNSGAKDTAYNVWKFIRNNIPYRLDPSGFQFVNTPANAWHNRHNKQTFCDCKSYAVMAWSLLKHLGIPVYRRFVSYDVAEAYTHVYVVVIVDGKTILVDPCLEYFNVEKKYKYKKDV